MRTELTPIGLCVAVAAGITSGFTAASITADYLFPKPQKPQQRTEQNEIVNRHVLWTTVPMDLPRAPLTSDGRSITIRGYKCLQHAPLITICKLPY